MLIQTIKKLESKKPLYSSAHLDAEILLSFIIKKPKEFLYTHPEKKLNQKQISSLKRVVNARFKQMPIAYIIGKKEFYDLNFYVNKDVLIPRPETEILVDTILNYSHKISPYHPDKSKGMGQAGKNSKLAIADIGTGSGCIAITLARHLPYTKIYASDISQKALRVAKKNAQALHAKIQFLQGNLLEPIKNKKNDIIVANLPYLKDSFLYSKKLESLSFEPQLALKAGENGLDIYKQLFEQMQQYALQPKALFCEIGVGQKTLFTKMAKKYLKHYSLHFQKDLSGVDRVAIFTQ